MGGIAGIFSTDSREVTTDLIGRMTQTLRHRGPDDEGYLLIGTSPAYHDPRIGDSSSPELIHPTKHVSSPLHFPPNLAFGHRRLSIIDTSSAGHQPMPNNDNSIWIIYDGEIYNHSDLRQELISIGYSFRSNTDTEVILHSYEHWDIDCLHKFNGMWAFAIWDSRRNRIFCSTDRFGIKPFYYSFDGQRFIFASEIKAVLQAHFIQRQPNYQTIFDYLAYRAQDYSEDTFFDGIKQLRGSHYLEFLPNENNLTMQRYYHLPLNDKLSGLTDDEYAQHFYKLFEDSVRLHVASEVPIGSCLSGGLDSSSIVCIVDKLMREDGFKLPGNENNLKTFSVRFNDNRHDEGFFIDEVVRKTQADAHHIYVTGEDLWEVMPQLIWYHEEPLPSTTTYIGWQLFKLVKQSGVKVALQGFGADGYLTGEDCHFPYLFSYLMQTFQWRALVREYYFHIRLHGGIAITNLLKAVYHLLPQNIKPWVREVIAADGKPCLSKDFAASFTGYPFRENEASKMGLDFFNHRLYEETVFYGRTLWHTDRNSMAHSIESRMPFRDHRLVEFSFAMPWDQKIRRGTRKFVLRNAMKGLLPESVATRQDKMGGATPEAVWLRTHLAEHVSEIINSQSFQQRPFFDARKVRQEFKGYQQGRRNLETTLWRWINLELWLRTFVD